MTSSGCYGDGAHLLHVAYSHKLQRTTIHLWLQLTTKPFSMDFCMQLHSRVPLLSELHAHVFQTGWCRLHVIYAPHVHIAEAFKMYASPQDAWTPLKVAGAVAVINLAGDYYLIIQKGLGVVGAGITCPVAQYFGAIVFMIYLHRMGKREKGIPLSWQVKVKAQYLILCELL